MTGALLSFSGMAVSIRGLADVLNVFEILSIRSGSGFFVLGMLAILRPELRRALRLDLIRIHLLRNTVHFGAQVAWTKSLTLLPLATVFALEFTTPAWVAVLAVLFLGERMTGSRAATIFLGLLGVVVIVRPGLGDFQPAALLVIASAVGFAITFVTTKKLTGTESTFAILFWMNLIQLPMNLHRQRSLVRDAPRSATPASGGRGHHFRSCVALLHHQRISLRRCAPRCPARFPPAATDCLRWVDVLRRGPRCAGLYWRRLHSRRNYLESMGRIPRSERARGLSPRLRLGETATPRVHSHSPRRTNR